MFYFSIIVVLLILVSYAYFTRNFGYWKKRGVFFIPPLPIVGNAGSIVLLKLPIGRFLHDIYIKYPKEPYLGIFLGNTPCFVIRDAELINKILTKDFHHFNQRIFGPTSDIDPLGAKSLFALHGTEWKNTRSQLSRGFTGLKLREMYEFILETAKQVEKKIDKVKRNGWRAIRQQMNHRRIPFMESTIKLGGRSKIAIPLHTDRILEAKSLCANFTVDTIAAAVLGIKGQALEGKSDVLLDISNKISSDNLISGLKNNFAFLLPQLFQLFHTALFPASAYSLMREIVWKVVNLREEGQVNRDDFFRMLLELRKKGGWDIGNGHNFELEGDNFVAQLFMFLTAGFETVSSALTFCMYELAVNQDVQDQLRLEIRQVLPEGGADVSYNDVMSMKYLDMVIHESLRKHPSFPFLDRRCTIAYKLPDGLTLEKGTFVTVPMLGVHHDEKYWPNPQKFDPERFRNPEDYAEKPYLAFSNGPRTCLGMRFALLEMKVALIYCLRNHKLLLNVKVPADIGFNPRRFNNIAKSDVLLDVVKV